VAGRQAGVREDEEQHQGGVQGGNNMNGDDCHQAILEKYSGVGVNKTRHVRYFYSNRGFVCQCSSGPDLYPWGCGGAVEQKNT
jgi:hypothetical protein